MAYYTAPSECTQGEAPGWYYENDEGDIVGPFLTKTDALDDESDGAYSSWLDYQRDEMRTLGMTYREEMRDAGRGHLLGHDE